MKATITITIHQQGNPITKIFTIPDTRDMAQRTKAYNEIEKLLADINKGEK